MELSRAEITSLWQISQTFTETANRDFRDVILPDDPQDVIADKGYAACRKLNEALQVGRYFAIGFAEPRRFGDSPVAIPSKAWEPDPTGFRIIDWPDFFEKWSYEQFVFCDVRIAASARHKIKTGGRDTLRPIFNDAITQMANDNEINTSKEQKTHFDAVRSKSIELYPMHKAHISKASNRTVAKYFSPIYNELKARANE